MIWWIYNGIYSINGIGRKIRGGKPLLIANSKKKYPGRPAEAPLPAQVVSKRLFLQIIEFGENGGINLLNSFH